MPLDFLRQDGSLAPADDLKWWKLVVTNDLKVSIGCFREIFWWMSFESEEQFEQPGNRRWSHGQMQEIASR